MFVNISGYQFTRLTDLKLLRDNLLQQCLTLYLKGTILLSHEGININLSGESAAIDSFITTLTSDPRFNKIYFQRTYSEFKVFKRLKVKIKKEIITLRQIEINPTQTKAQTITPQLLKEWLDKKCDFTLLDTRNTYETQFGTFKGAKKIAMQHFCQFPEVVNDLPKEKPIVMFCTGGIRCEKAALVLLAQGHQNVFQLQGGILNYFATIGGSHYEGDCFVFDDRVAVDSNLKMTGTLQCLVCQGPIVNKQCKLCPPEGKI